MHSVTTIAPEMSVPAQVGFAPEQLMPVDQAASAPETYAGFSLQPLAPMFDALMLAGRGSRTERHESMLHTQVGDLSVQVLPLYQKFENPALEYLKVVTTNTSGETKGFMLQGDRVNLSPEGYSNWTIAPKFGESVVRLATRDMAQEALGEVIDRWAVLSEDKKAEYMARLVPPAKPERRSIASRFAGRIAARSHAG